ncbi:type IV pilin protein [Herbaspirillum lusitanum]|uniref:Type IV pilin protein n=1 Tax=Herbaspirillum lusitanum TaxID=213312 RepID=A0ABW9A4A3_9BURK
MHTPVFAPLPNSPCFPRDAGRPRRPSNTGFTLLELMVVLALVGLLAGFGFKSYQQYVLRMKRVEGRNALYLLMQQQERYFSQNNSYLPFDEALQAGGLKWHSADTPAASAYQLQAAACDGDDIRHCVKLSAVPGSAVVNTGFHDPECGTLTLNSRGLKTQAGRSEGKTAGPGSAVCW